MMAKRRRCPGKCTFTSSIRIISLEEIVLYMGKICSNCGKPKKIKSLRVKSYVDVSPIGVRR